MKKITSVFVLLGLVSGAATAAPSHIARDGRGGYNVTYDYTDKAKTGWYIGGRAELSFLNWKNKYSSDYIGVDTQYGDDGYSFEPVFGGAVSAGYRFDYFWRAELEAGYIGQFSDSDAWADFKLSAPYLMANGYYDFTNGLYVGAGAGIAVPTTELDGNIFYNGDRKKTSVSPMLGVMLGYSYKLDHNLVLDLRYRLAGFMGAEQERGIEWREDALSEWQQGYFKNDIDLILDNSVSIGLRYEF